MSRNNVRGPTSALTEFLREQGITARTVVSPRRARASEDATAGPSNAEDVELADEGVDEDVRRTNRSRMCGYASDDLDKTDEDYSGQPAKKQRLSKTALGKSKAKQKTKTRKGKKKGDTDDYSNDSEEDEYTALSKGGFTRIGKGNVLPPPGTFETCATCDKRFTVTRYTLSAKSGPGFLCHSCAKASGADPFKKPAAPRKRKDPAEKRKIISFEEADRVPSLTTMCIEVIGKHIEDVEALGDIGSFNMNEIARVIAKNRSLTAENSQLFYDVSNRALTLYDATNLLPEALCTLGSLNPNLENLRLDYCGCMDDTSLMYWASHLTSLARIELLGPFLVRAPAWISFLDQKGPHLRGFLVTQSPRFDMECVETLAKCAVNLTELRLSEIGKLSNDWLPKIASLSTLTSLELSKPARSLSDAACIELLQAIGSNLTHLSLSGNEELSDAVILDGILCHATRLKSLALASLPLVTDPGIAELFGSWSANPPLEIVDLSRNNLPSSAALSAVLVHSGGSLRELTVNGWRGTSTESLMELGSKARSLTRIDLGWCRGVDDYVIKSLLDGCPGLREIKCYGCNRVTVNCPRKSNVKILGVESHTMG